MEAIPINNSTATRWQGLRLIDFYLSNLEQHSHAEARVLELRISDRKIVELQLDLAHKG